MKVILPVAGKGTRLRPHTHTRAKSLVHVAGKAVLEHIVQRIAPLEPEQLIFITDDNGSQIEEFMKHNFAGIDCRYIVQKERKGPAHAVFLAAPHIAPGDDILIVFNDTIFVADLTCLTHFCSDCDGLVYSKEVDDYQRFGVNVIKEGLIVEMVEKPDRPVSRLAQVGLYYLKDGERFMDYLDKSLTEGETVKGEYYLPAVFMKMIGDGMKLRAPEIDQWLDCGTTATLLETNKHLLVGRHHIHGETFNTVLIEPVHIEKGAVIRDSVLGPNVSVASGTVIEQSFIKDSIINSNNRISNVVLKDSILGDAVHLIGSFRRMNIGDHSLIEMQ